MKQNKPEFYKAVFIKWLDSVQRQTPWWRTAELEDKQLEKDEKDDYFWSCGYLIKTTKRYYYLATSIHFEENEAVSFGTIFLIPKGSVQLIQPVTKSKL